jgi:uncharacterized protein
MKLRRFEDVLEFYEQVEGYLLSNQLQNKLILDTCSILNQLPEDHGLHPLMATVEEDDEIVAVTVKIPGQKLMLSKINNLDSLEFLIHHLDSRFEEIPGVIGIAREAEIFAQTWRLAKLDPSSLSVSQRRYKLQGQLRSYSLDAVNSVPEVKGYFRPGLQSDRSLLLKWFTGLLTDVWGYTREHMKGSIDAYIDRKAIYLWQDGNKPVSMAMAFVDPKTGGQIELIYTPPEMRKKGYSTACLAALSQHLLKRGSHRCWILTDLRYPIANHVYEKIGYKPLCDWHDYSFV